MTQNEKDLRVFQKEVVRLNELIALNLSSVWLSSDDRPVYCSKEKLRELLENARDNFENHIKRLQSLPSSQPSQDTINTNEGHSEAPVTF